MLFLPTFVYIYYIHYLEAPLSYIIRNECFKIENLSGNRIFYYHILSQFTNNSRNYMKLNHLIWEEHWAVATRGTIDLNVTLIFILQTYKSWSLLQFLSMQQINISKNIKHISRFDKNSPLSNKFGTEMQTHWFPVHNYSMVPNHNYNTPYLLDLTKYWNICKCATSVLR